MEYVLKSIFATTIVIANASIVAAFWRQNRLQMNPTNVYLTSLAMCDLLTGLLPIPAFIVTSYYERERYEPPTTETCKIITFVLGVLVTTTTFHLLLISADRYVKLKHDFFYIKHINVEFAYKTCCVVWLVNIVSLSLIVEYLIDNFSNSCEHQYFASGVVAYICQTVFVAIFTGVPIIVSVVLNGQVLKIARRTKKLIQLNCKQDGDVTDCNQLLAILLKEHKTALIIFTINICYLTTWPLDGAFYILMTRGPTHWRDFINGSFLKYVHPWLGLSNSLFNPIILFVMHHDFRHAFIHRVCRGCATAV